MLSLLVGTGHTFYKPLTSSGKVNSNRVLISICTFPCKVGNAMVFAVQFMWPTCVCTSDLLYTFLDDHLDHSLQSWALHIKKLSSISVKQIINQSIVEIFKVFNIPCLLIRLSFMPVWV